MGEIDAAYAKGLEDAVEIIQEIEGDDYLFRRLATIHRLTTSILALSSIPPGSRVVVVPPEGSPEREALLKRLASEVFLTAFGGTTDPDSTALVESFAYVQAGATLRALIGGDDR